MSIVQDSTATLRPDLTAACQEFDTANAIGKFIADAVFPIFPSQTDTGEYAIFKRENVLEVPDTARNEGGYNRVAAAVASKTFACQENGLEFVLSDKQARKYGRYLDFEMAMAAALRYKILLARERRAATLAATLTGTNAGTDWLTIATADPATDVALGVTAICDNCGASPEGLALIVSRTDYGYLCNNAKVLDRLKYTSAGVQRGLIAPEIIAQVLGVGRLLIGQSGYNTKGKGVVPVLSQIWGRNAYVALLGVNGQPLETPCLGRTILWTGDSPSLPVVETYRDETVRANVLRVREDSDEVLQGVDANIFGYRISTNRSA